jgi:hypothetical protein
MGRMFAFRPSLFCSIVALSVSGASSAQSAQSSSKPKPSPQSSTTKSATASPANDDIYRNPTFSFSYQSISGWVDRTSEMQADSGGASGQKVLLARFERPPQAAGDTVNSAVVIAQEGVSAYPGLKTAADYVAPLTELVTKQGFKAAGDAYEITIATRTLVRCDFVRAMGNIAMHQSTLVIVQKGSIVSFTFLGGSEDEVDALVERLSFSTSARPARK